MVRGVKSILYNCKGEVLMLMRGSDAPTNPNTWGFPGGGLNIDELPLDGANRENGEEIGIFPRIKMVKVIFFSSIGTKQTSVPVWVFVGEEPICCKSIVLSESEEREYWFFPTDELPDLSDYSRIVAQGILF